MRFYLQFVLAIVATLLFSNFAQAASGSQTSSAATISDPPRKNVDVPDGYTVKDNAGNVVVKTEGGVTATVYYLSEDRATVDRVNKVITLPCAPELTDSDSGDKDSKLTVKKGDVKIDKPGSYDVTGPCTITIQGSSAGDYTGNFTNPTNTAGVVDVNGSNGGSYVTTGPWVNR